MKLYTCLTLLYTCLTSASLAQDITSHGFIMNRDTGGAKNSYSEVHNQLEQAKAAGLARHPFRIINGATNSIAARDFMHFAGTVLGVYPEGVEIDGWYEPLNKSNDAPMRKCRFYVAHLPLQVADHDELEGDQWFLAKEVGTRTYNSADGPKTLHLLDYGTPCPAPAPEKVASAAPTQPPRETTAQPPRLPQKTPISPTNAPPIQK